VSQVITISSMGEAVIAALNQNFPAIAVYGEEVSEGFPKPSFFVKLSSVTQDREVGNRYKRDYTFDIQYFGSTYAEFYQTAEQLYACLETLSDGESSCRGTVLKTEIVDGVLHFSVVYSLHMMRTKPAEPVMQNLSQEGSISG
jgi:hypothetical protein